ncbi:hypothetical protein TrST_g4778 [Triparma strigata]|uniref:Uncharacterized protein n=1 Tax=Triparma strigata TaxID=1606541 RepID=A0A9W7AZS3_9STRA|nr:hypothetical protein TrST_g4778 [Triparma strigata]
MPTSLPTTTPTFTLPQLRSFLDHTAEQFVLQSKSISEGDVEFVRNIVLFATSSDNLASFEEKRKQLAPARHTEVLATVNEQEITALPKGFSSIGKVLSSAGKVKSTPPRVTLMTSKNKIMPMENQLSTALNVLSSPDATMYGKNYNKDLEIESEIVRQMNNEMQMYTDEEDNMINSAIGLNSGLKMKGAIPFRDLKPTFSTTKFFRGFYNTKLGDIYSMATCTLRGNHSWVAARLTNYHYHCKNPAFGLMKEQLGDEEIYLEVPNKHSMVFKTDYAFPSPLTNRESIVKIVWKRLSEKSVMVSYHPLASHPKVENKDGKAVIRGSLQLAMLVTQLDDKTTELQWGTHLNFGGNLPTAVINGFIIPNFNRANSHHQAFFAYSIRLQDLTKKDGKLLGEVLINQIKAARKKGGWKKRAELGKVGIDEFLYISAAMRELLPRHPWIRALLHEISLNKVNVAPTVTTTISDVKDKDAINLAKGLSTIILTNTEASAAVDHWIAQNAALEEFEKDYEWMRSFFVEVAQYNLTTSNFGLRLRVFAGALLSTIDLVTDVYMTIKFFNTDGQEGYGKINAWLIGLTMFCQILIGYANNSKKPSHLVKDALAILVGFKPALDAYRVGSGSEQEDHQIFPPLQDMSYCKGIEVVFEAIPSSVVQIYALLLAKEKGLDAVVSVLISAATIAFTSSVISYDWDTSPEQRRKVPFHYGYIPDKATSRAICFLSMMSLSFAHVMLRTFSCALLVVTNKRWLLYYLAADMGLFFLYKIVRKDFFYYVNLTGIARLVGTIVERITIKVMVDFTMLIHVRGPCELGGFWFLATSLISLVGSVASVALYNSHYNDEDVKLDAATLQTVVGILGIVWVSSAIALVSVMNRKYLSTFYNFDTASDYERKCFLNAREDQDDVKSDLLTDHPDVYRTWGDEHLKPWTLKNWDRWEEEKPAWFTDSWIECVPNDYIPYDWRVKYNKTKGRLENPQMRRRSSVQQMKMLMGGVEEK